MASAASPARRHRFEGWQGDQPFGRAGHVHGLSPILSRSSLALMTVAKNAGQRVLGCWSAISLNARASISR